MTCLPAVKKGSQENYVIGTVVPAPAVLDEYSTETDFKFLVAQREAIFASPSALYA